MRVNCPRAPIAALLLGLAVACARAPDPAEPEADPPATEPAGRHRVRAAAINLRFVHGRTGDSAQDGDDRLQVAAAFADADPRDSPMLAALVGRPRAWPGPPLPDTCVRMPELMAPADTVATPQGGWLQLLDVGNVELAAGSQRLPLRVGLVPSVTAATRGVRYDGHVDLGRSWLAAGTLELRATGGDGVAPFVARIAVPRPVRLTHLGTQAARGGKVAAPAQGEDLRIRWGSVDGTAGLELRIGSEAPGSLGWLRCRLVDDGEFTVPQMLVEALPPRSADRPWLVVLARSREAQVPGFEGTPLRLELIDSVHVY